MKKLLKIFFALVLVLIVVGLAAPFFISVDTYKAEIVKQVKAKTGRDLTIAGPMSIRILPLPTVHLEKVALSNPKGYSAASMVQVESANIEVALMPLLSKQIQVKSLVLDKPVIDLEVSASGVPNWQFTPPDQVPEAPVRHSELSLISDAEAAMPPPGGFGDAIAMLQQVQLSNVQVHGGTLRYADQRTRKVTTLEEANLHLSMPSLSSELALDGDAKFNGQKVSLTASLKSPQDVLLGKQAALHFRLASDPLHVTLDGHATLTDAQGDLVLDAPSLPKLSAWATGTQPQAGKTPQALALKSKLTCAPTHCIFDNANLHLDQTALTGKVAISWMAAVPYIVADLHADALDLTPYMQAAPQKHASLLISDALADAPASGWSTERIDASALRSANADVRLSLGKLTLNTFKLGQTNLVANLKNGVLKADVPQAALYDGQGRGDLMLDGTGSDIAVTTHATLSGVQAQPLLKDMAQFDRLSGKTDFTLSAAGRGASQRDIIGTLNGEGKLVFTNGAFRGVNLGSMVRSAKALLSGGSAAGGSDSDQTDFSELSGTYTITRGVVHNADLVMKAPLLRMRGTGDIDLPQRYVRYRLTPELVGSTQGQGGKDLPGIAVPVIAEGPFEHVSFRPDVKSATNQLLKNPTAVKNTVKSLKDQLNQSGGVKNLLNSLGR